jgi:hypothetical protein
MVSHRSSLLDRESLYESTELSKEARDFAALLASKVYYFLGEYDESLSFALGAGKAFEEETYKQGLEEYVETIVCQCFICLAWIPCSFRSGGTAKAIDRYIQLRADAQPSGTRKLIHVCLRLSRQFSTVALPMANTSRCVHPGCDLEVIGNLVYLVLERQSVSPSNHGGWTSSNGSMSKQKTFPCYPMPWKP